MNLLRNGIFIRTEHLPLLKGAHLSHICLDGKSVSGTQVDRGRPLHLVGAYADQLSLVLAQSRASSSGNAKTNAAMGCLNLIGSRLKEITRALLTGQSASKRRKWFTIFRVERWVQPKL